MHISLHSSPIRQAYPPAAANAPAPLKYDKPSMDDLFEGSKPQWGPVYDKYIASTQVPDAVDPKEYYDQAADDKLARAYYGDIENLQGSERMKALRNKVTSSHTPHPKGYHYVVAKHLYTDVDRRPDGTVRSIYNKEPVKFLTYPDISLDTLTEKELCSIAGACTSSPEVIANWMGFQKGHAEYNCEHVVPQSYFNKAEPMRSDLHHLYACDFEDNSRRGAQPYGRYQPEGGRGEVARATLYFLMRYPEVRTPYDSSDVEMLKTWSQEDPPQLHEKRRNHEIQKIQGNRNPFIDHPEWVKDFSLR